MNQQSTSVLNSFFAKKIGSFSSSLFLQELIESARQGHLCLQKSDPVDLPSSIMEEGHSLFPESLIVKYGNLYYLQKNWVCETHVLQQVLRLKNQKADCFHNSSLFREQLHQEAALLPEQKIALQSAFDSSFSLICGGPGTGKTYTAGFLVRFLVASLDRSVKKQYRIVLAAPTGKAALHLQSSLLARGPLGENISYEASTLHRLLKLKPGETKLFSKKRIDADLIIVDEASMIDLSLFAHLLEAIRDGTRLVLMGDPNQLPPIETGSLFAECADLFGVFLKRCMRMETLALQKSADAILAGDEEGLFESISFSERFDAALFSRLSAKFSTCVFLEKPDPEECLKRQSRFCILNALRQGPLGTEALNQKILDQIERQCKAGQWWAIPILATTNLPHLNLYNGARGVLIGQKGTRLDLLSGEAYFVETGSTPLKRLPLFEVSFALSIHKSQGSEFDEVAVLLPEGSENFGREALYTAATRAKKDWELIGQKETLCQMLLRRSRKCSGFSKRYTRSS